jgi:hypothetical protein
MRVGVIQPSQDALEGHQEAPDKVGPGGVSLLEQSREVLEITARGWRGIAHHASPGGRISIVRSMSFDDRHQLVSAQLKTARAVVARDDRRARAFHCQLEARGVIDALQPFEQLVDLRDVDIPAEGPASTIQAAVQRMKEGL